MKNLLFKKFTGRLKVVIRDIGEFNLDFSPEIIGFTPDLFDYIGQAYANLTTNLTTRLKIETKPDDWKTIYFSPSKRILIAQRIKPDEELHQIRQDEYMPICITPFNIPPIETL